MPAATRIKKARRTQVHLLTERRTVIDSAAYGTAGVLLRTQIRLDLITAVDSIAFCSELQRSDTHLEFNGGCVGSWKVRHAAALASKLQYNDIGVVCLLTVRF